MINITAQDSDTVTFEVINKPDTAIVNQRGNVLGFKWPVTSSREVGLLTLLLAVILIVLRSISQLNTHVGDYFLPKTTRARNHAWGLNFRIIAKHQVRIFPHSQAELAVFSKPMTVT